MHTINAWYHRSLIARTVMGVFMSMSLVVWTAGPSIALANQGTQQTPSSTNPTLANSCGLDIALVLDNSASISSSELSTMKSRFTTFVNALVPATPTEFSVVKFNKTASVVSTFSASATTIATAIGNVGTSNGATNWEDGLLKAQSTFDPRPVSTHPNLIIFASDGVPDVHGTSGVGPANNQVDLTSLNAAIAQANTIKAGGTRIATLGIGVSGANANNLKAISSNDAYYNASDFNTGLQTALAQIISDTCGGTVTVHKVVDQNGQNLASNSDTDQTPGADVGFTVGSTPATTDVNGMTAAVPLTNGTYGVTETVPTNSVLVGASCLNGNVSTGSFNGTTGVTGVVMGTDNVISCTFYNAPLPTLTVVKTVVNDPHEVAPEVSSNYPLHVKSGSTDVANSPANGSSTGTLYTLTPGSYSVSEDASTAPNTGTYTPSFSDSCANGSVTLNYGDTTTCTLTNTENQLTGTLVITKDVVNAPNNGTEEASDFTDNISVAGASNPVITAGATADTETLTYTGLVPGDYAVSETATTGYSSSIVCGEAGTTAHVAAESSAATCTITNTALPGTLHIVKSIHNDGGGTATADNFQFQIPGVNSGNPITFNANGHNDIQVPADTYDVSEIVATNYENPTYSDGAGDCSQITVTNGGDATCTITNTYVAPPAQCPQGDTGTPPNCVPPPQECSVTPVTVVSDATTADDSGTTTVITPTDLDAGILPGVWTTISGASWIWSNNYLADTTTVDKTEVFTKTFTIANATSSAVTLDMSADNGYSISVNGTLLDNSNFGVETNYSTDHTYDISNLVHQGSNTITFTVKNFALAGSGFHNNPGGLIYKISYTDNECTPPPPTNSCVAPTGAATADAVSFGVSTDPNHPSLQSILTTDGYTINTVADQQNSQEWDGTNNTVHSRSRMSAASPDRRASSATT